MFDLEKFESHPLLKGLSWEYFKASLSAKAPSTQENYLPTFVKFLEWYGKDTDEFYREAYELTKADDPRAVKLIPMKVREYQDVIIRRGRSTGTANTIKKAVLLFLQANEIKKHFTDSFKNGNQLKVISKPIESVSKDEIKLLLETTASYRDKAIISFLKDSGIRESDAGNVTIEMLGPAIEDESIQFWTWEMIIQKTGKQGFPAIGYEALKWIRHWMRYRKKTGIENDYLFTTIKPLGSYKTKDGYQSEGCKKGDRMNGRAISAMLTYNFKKSGLKELGKSGHSLRKYHATSLLASGMQQAFINHMIGRKSGSGTELVYIRTTEQQRIEEYKKHYLALAIEVESQGEQINQLMLENQELKRQMEEMQSVLKQIEPFINQYRSSGEIAKSISRRKKKFSRISESLEQ